MEIPVATPMLAFYHSDQPTYQPTHAVPLQLEDGNPQASLENLKRLNLSMKNIRVRKQLRRVLFQFLTGEQYVALGLSDPATLAAVAAENGLGDYDALKLSLELLAGGDESTPGGEFACGGEFDDMEFADRYRPVPPD